MSTSDEFPQIPTAEELLAEVRDRENQLANEANLNNGVDLSGGYNPSAENLRTEYAPAEVEQFRGNPPYMDARLPDERYEELKKTFAENSRRPVFDIKYQQPQVVELSPLVKAYARFTSEQTLFLETGAGLTGVEYQQALWRYSKEQTLLMRAQAAALRQAGVL